MVVSFRSWAKDGLVANLTDFCQMERLHMYYWVFIEKIYEKESMDLERPIWV